MCLKMMSKWFRVTKKFVTLFFYQKSEANLHQILCIIFGVFLLTIDYGNDNIKKHTETLYIVIKK